MSSSSISSPNVCPAKVRVVGKIRNFTESEKSGSDSRCWINVREPQDDVLPLNKVTVSFSDQSSNASKKDASYELNVCYHQDEDIDALFTREVRPLISEVFQGRDASIIAYGARGSGKTVSIQGMSDKPGLSTMTMGELISKARDSGKSVFISMYEVFNEHAYDLLDSKNPEIQVFEDSRGRIKLKGLSQVSVESLSQFDEYRSRSFSGKILPKIPPEMPKRSHKVVVIYISSMGEPSSINRGGKMNFVDLAGYEDTRRKSSDGNTISESVRINKSLHAIMNVIYALNTNDNRVPFRESKLTRMLQESLGGSNQILLLACMNPLFCQDTIHTVSVASRSCQNYNRMLTDSTKKGNSSSSVASRSSQNNNRVLPDSTKKGNSSTIVASLSCQNNNRVQTDSTKKGDNSIKVQSLLSQKIVKPSGTPKVVKKQVDRSVLLSTKKTSIMSSGRKIKVAKENICSQVKFPKGDDDSTKMIDKLQESTTTEPISQLEEDPGNNSLKNSHMDLVSDEVCQPKSTVEQEGEVCYHNSAVQHEIEVEVGQHDSIVEHEGKDSKHSSTVEHEGEVIYKDSVDNMDVTPAVINEKSVLDHACADNTGTFGGGSPPLSERLRELSINLKLFCSSTPSRHKLLQQETIPIGLTEPKTPDTNNHYMNVKNCSPWDAFSKGSSRMKDSLVQESLHFFNTASKEELKKLKGIGEKRATYILELREESPVPFKNLEDLSEIGLSAKQIKGVMRNVAGELFS